MTRDLNKSVFLPHPRVAYRTIGERAVLVQIETNAMLKLNEVGTAIWGWLDGRTLDAVVDALQEHFVVSADEARRDTLEFLATLQERDLVERKP